MCDMSHQRLLVGTSGSSPGLGDGALTAYEWFQWILRRCPHVWGILDRGGGCVTWLEGDMYNDD